MRYLSGSPYPACMRWARGGLMFTPEMGNTPDLTGVTWAADNGCYTAGDRFSADRWLAFLARWRGQGRCLFAVLPDVPFDHDATLARSLPYVEPVRALGYRPALAIQNGASVAHIPWEQIDAVFIAGDKPFKTSATAWLVCREAKRQRKHIHIARRNSQRAMQAAYDMGADTIDGTFLKFAPDHNWLRLQRWFTAFCPHAATELTWGNDPRFLRCRDCGADLWRIAETAPQSA